MKGKKMNFMWHTYRQVRIGKIYKQPYQAVSCIKEPALSCHYKIKSLIYKQTFRDIHSKEKDFFINEIKRLSNRDENEIKNEDTKDISNVRHFNEHLTPV